MSEGRYQGLDALRAVAILSVIAFHAFRVAPAGVDPALARVMEAGWAGVDLFFSLSGFLVSTILMRTVGRPGWYRGFLVRRALRILPLYALVVGGIVIGRSLAGQPMPAPAWSFGAFLANYWIAYAGGVYLPLDITWSLSVEEQFYLLWSALVAAVGARGLGLLSAALVVTSPVLRWFVHEPGSEASYMLTPCRLDAIAWGTLAATVVQQRWRPGAEGAARFVPVGLCAIAGLIAMGGFDKSERLFAAGGISLLGMISAGLVLVLASGARPGWGRWLEASPLTRIGQRSYGMYMLHPLLLMVAVKLVPAGLPPDLRVLLLFGLTSALTLGAAELSWRVIEAPILAEKERLAPVG
jgi:peptidoglycan/LPS O-acetylase OafA/YrhL